MISVGCFLTSFLSFGSLPRRPCLRLLLLRAVGLGIELGIEAEVAVGVRAGVSA